MIRTGRIGIDEGGALQQCEICGGAFGRATALIFKRCGVAWVVVLIFSRSIEGALCSGFGREALFFGDLVNKRGLHRWFQSVSLWRVQCGRSKTSLCMIMSFYVDYRSLRASAYRGRVFVLSKIGCVVHFLVAST